MSLPTPDDAIAFVVFFFPGFITLLLVFRLCRINLRQRSDLEKVVLSSIFSIISFLVVGVSLEAESIATAIFTVDIILRVFLASVALAIALSVIIKAWDAIADISSARSQRFWSKLGRTYIGSDTCSSFLLRQLYDAREKNELVIVTTSGEIYKGSFQGYGIHPTEIILAKTEKIPIKKLVADHWDERDEYLILFNEKDIRRISAVGIG
jgi:hypothetical protein